MAVRILLSKQLNNDTSALPSFTLSGANQPVAGRKLYIGVGAWNGVGEVGNGVTDSKGNTYTRKDGSTAISNARSQLYGCDYSGTGDVTITVGRSSNDWLGVYSWLFCIEVDDLISSEVDSAAFGQAAGSTSGVDASVTGAAATVQARNLIIAMATVNSSANPAGISTASSGYTEIMSENNGSANECGNASYKYIDAIETPSATWSYNDTSAAWHSSIIVLRRQAAAGGAAKGGMLMGVG